MSAFRVSEALRLAAAAGLLALAACSDSGAGPLGSLDEAAPVPPVHGLVIHNVFPAGSRPECEFWGYLATIQQGAREADAGVALTYLPAEDRYTRLLEPERLHQQGIDPGRELVMTLKLAGVGRRGSAPLEASCTAEAGRRWQFRGSFQHAGGRIFTGDFRSFVEIGR